MRRLLVTLRYDGTAYHGWQVQKNALSVQTAVQDAMERVFGERPDLHGCSRTDAGVHAREYCFHFDTDRQITGDHFALALNRALPDDIAVSHCREVSLQFHARYSCTGKEYVYQLYNGKFRDPFHTRGWYFYPYRLDEELLHRAAQGFLGTHDFRGFCSVGGKLHDTVRTVTESRVIREGDEVRFFVTADGFLYNMVRIMTGTLLGVAQGRIAPDAIPAIIETKSRSAAGVTAPAGGLWLNRVFYPSQKGGDSDEA